MYVRRAGLVLSVVYSETLPVPPYSYDYKIEFRKFGANDLMQFGFLYYRQGRQNLSLANVGWGADWTMIFGGPTDWIGPMEVKAIANGDAQSVLFTGGNHLAGGLTTAATASIRFTDCETGRIIADGSEIETGSVQIDVINEVMAYNTAAARRPVLMENVTYRATQESVAVLVEHVAKEDVGVRTYYGMQAAFGGFHSGGTLHFAHSDNSQRQDYVSGLASGPLAQFPNVDRFNFRDGASNVVIVGWIDKDYGIAAAGALDETVFPRIFTSGAPGVEKVYFNLIRRGPGTEYLLPAHETMSWRGAYSMGFGKRIGGAPTGYIYPLRDIEGHPVIVGEATSKSRGMAYYLPPDFAGWRLEECDRFVTGTLTNSKSANGWGVYVSTAGAASVTMKAN